MPMTTTINNGNQTAHSRRVLANKGDAFSPFNAENFAVPHGKDEEWKFAPLRKLRGLHDDTAADPVAASTSVETAGRDSVAVDVVKRDDKRLGHAGTPTDRVAIQAYSNFDNAHVVTSMKNLVSKEPVVVDIDGPGEDSISYGHIVVDAQSHAEVICIINYRGSGTLADNIEFATDDGAKPSVVIMVNRNEDAAHDSMHHVRTGCDATLRHTVATFGGEVACIVPRVAFTTPGGDVDLPGVYLADTGQYFESRMLADRAVLNYHSNVMYKDTLQGESNVAHREARIMWTGDVLIRAKATGIGIYEFDRSLLLTEDACADAAPNLEIEAGEIAGAGHAATVGRFDEEQLFYPLSRGIPELATCRLMVRSFFSEVINLVPIESVREKLGKFVDEELSTAGF